jgi:hypothetical protein
LITVSDDIVVFARPDQGELRAVKEIMRCFEDASGLEVNYLKSLAAPIRCDEDTRAAVAPILACPFSSLPMSYLGLSVVLAQTHQSGIASCPRQTGKQAGLLEGSAHV